MKKPILRSLTLGLIILFVAQAAHAADLRMAVNAPRGATDAQRWQPLVDQLAAKTGKTIEVVPYSPLKIDDAIANGEVDFGLVNPVSAVVVIDRFKAKPMATLKAKGTAFFAGVIIAKKGRGITKVTDLKGKKVKAFNLGSSAGAYIFQSYHLLQQGIDVRKDFSEFKDAKKQDEIVLAVKHGLADAGFVRSGLLESMIKEEKIKLDEFVIIDERKDDLKLIHSTDLYPEWFLVATAKTDAKLIKQVQKAAMNVQISDEAAKIAEIDGFVEAQNLDSLRKALKALKMAPYEGS